MSLTPDLVLEGGYDPGLTAFLVRTLVPGARCVDIGANVGLFTVLMAHLVGPRGHVDAFEVSPTVIPLLRDNVALNYLNDRVKVHECAAYDRQTSLVFHATGRFQGNGSLRKHSSSYHDTHRVDSFEEVEVPADRLDALLDGGPVHLIKIDVEGGELAALRGLSRLVDAELLTNVVFELVRSLIGDDWEDLVELLAAWRTAGWGYSSISAAGELVPLDFQEMVRVSNYTSVVMAK